MRMKTIGGMPIATPRSIRNASEIQENCANIVKICFPLIFSNMQTDTLVHSFGILLLPFHLNIFDYFDIHLF